ncbi:MAG TPA: YncE family protein, partial [Acidobacteriaceae bacterium]
MAAVAGLAACVGALAGCGNAYRPVLATIGVVGPAGQPQKYAVAVSSPSPTSNGLMTLVDFSGDTVLVTASLGVNPYYLVLNQSGTTGYTLNSDKTVNSFDISTSLITSQVLESTL